MVDLAAKEATVSGGAFDPAALAAAVDQLGYQAQLQEDQPDTCEGESEGE